MKAPYSVPLLLLISLPFVSSFVPPARVLRGRECVIRSAEADDDLERFIPQTEANKMEYNKMERFMRSAKAAKTDTAQPARAAVENRSSDPKEQDTEQPARAAVGNRSSDPKEQDAHVPAYVRDPLDGSVRLDPTGLPLTVNRMLATKPLRSDLLTRPGPGRRELVYLSGESVIGTLNQIFGYDGWNLQVLETQNLLREQEDDSRWHAVYTARVRITLTATGTYKEDFGTGDSIDRQQGTALQLALKASVTDAVKRTARHFGNKLGNCLYQSGYSEKNAPKTLGEALDQFDQGN